MNILVVGGAGYIGSLMAKKLSGSSHSVVVLDNFSTGNRDALPNGIKVYEGDLGDRLILDEIFSAESISLVMHFAAKIQVGESIVKPDFYYNNNTSKVLVLLDAMKEYSVNKFIFSSTAAVYGVPEMLPIDEQHPTNPINPYGNSKMFTERIIKDYGKAFGLNSVIFRYFNAAGASLDGQTGESQKVKQNLIPIILKNIEEDKPTTIFGNDWDTPDGTCIRDYIHIEDIVTAHLMGVDYLDGGGKSEIFNLGSGRGQSVLEVLDAIRELHQGKVKTIVGHRRDGDPDKLVASSEKAKEVLGWVAKQSEISKIADSAYHWHFNRRY